MRLSDEQYEIDLKQPHHKMQPHVHHCNEKGYRKSDEKDSDMLLTKKLQEKVRVVWQTYYNHKKEISGEE